MNIGSLMEDNIQRFGKYESVYFEGRWYTNVETNEASNRLGNALKSLGIAKGDRVAIQMPNSPPVLASFSAIYKIGAIVVPISPLLRPDQSAFIFQNCGAKAVITSSEYVGFTRQAQAQAPSLPLYTLLVQQGSLKV
jgi:long-chain acyl-CoA synthetase